MSWLRLTSVQIVNVYTLTKQGARSKVVQPDKK